MSAATPTHTENSGKNSPAPSNSDSSPESKEEALLFGEIAVELKLATSAQISSALELQKKQIDSQQPGQFSVKRLGEILLERNQLALRDVQKILLQQKRRREQHGERGNSQISSFGPFQIQSVLGTGGMSIVYKARDPDLNRTIALKVLSLRLNDDPEFLARFEREVQTTSALTHPNIVAGFGSGRHENRPYLAMEFVDGLSLGKILQKNERLPERRSLEIVREVARALDYAHGHGIIHRDVKPDNVLLGTDGSIKLTDFGLAKLLRQDQRLTQSGIAIGTPHYISPEQVSASRYTDHRADLYSLGAMLFHMLSGKIPFEGDNNNDIMLKHLNDPMPDIRKLAPDTSSATAAIVAKLMAKKASDRYESAAQLIEDLNLAISGKRLLHAGHSISSMKAAGNGKSGCLMVVFFCLAAGLFVAKLRPWR